VPSGVLLRHQERVYKCKRANPFSWLDTHLLRGEIDAYGKPWVRSMGEWLAYLLYLVLVGMTLAGLLVEYLGPGAHGG